MTTRPRTATPTLPALAMLKIAAEAAQSKKADDIIGLDLTKLQGVSDYFLICSGQSEPQVKAITEAIEEQLRLKGAKPWHVEGLSRRWMLLDYVDLVVHVFHEQTREYYLLERLWGDAGRVDLGLE